MQQHQGLDAVGLISEAVGTTLQGGRAEGSAGRLSTPVDAPLLGWRWGWVQGGLRNKQGCIRDATFAQAAARWASQLGLQYR